MPVLLNYPLFHADDDDGAPLTGGLLYSYIAGTSTEKATYTTRAMTTANANPVVLNSRGEAVIYGAGLYKLVLQTAAGVVIWTQDNVEMGPGQGAYSFFVDPSETDQGAAGSGSSLYDILTALGTGKKATVYFPHNGTGNTTSYAVGTSFDASAYTNVTLVFENGALLTVATGVTLTLPPPVNIEASPNQQIFSGAGTVTFGDGGGVISVMWFGAKGDNSTDNTTTIQKAFTAATGASIGYTTGGGNSVYAMPEVFFPAGHYLISDSIDPGYVSRIKGDRSFIRCTDDTKDIFTFTNGYVETISEITFIGGKSHITFTNANVGPSEIYIDRCEFTLGHTEPVFVVTVTAPATNMSLQVMVTNCKFLYNYQIMENYIGADFIFRDCEFIGTNPIAAVAQFVNYSNLTLDRWQGAPSAGACPSGARWIDNYNSVVAYNCRFGGEGNGMPIVYNYVGPDGTYVGGSGAVGNGMVVITDSTVIPGATGVENCLIKFMTDIPQIITIRGNHWLSTDGTSFFKSDAGFDIATYLGALDAFAHIWIEVSNNESLPTLQSIGFPADLAITNIDQVHITGDIPLPQVTFTADDATPSVANRNSFVTANVNPTTITDFDDGVAGQVIFVRFGDAVTTVDFGARGVTWLQGNQGADWSPGAGDYMTCVFDGTYWSCTIVEATA